MGREVENEAMATEAPLAPITARRKVPSNLEEKLPKPYLARALAAPDTDHPNGTVGHTSQDMSVLQQHISFFDRDKDGIIYPWETYAGLRAIGFNTILSFISAVIINGVFSYLTLPGWIPSLLFPIYISSIHKCKHGSDTGSFDTEGRFIPANFENIFSKYARTVTDKLTFRELWSMTEGNRITYDPFGWTASKLEWIAFWFIAKGNDGFLSKEAVRRCYDGTIFEYLAKKKMGSENRMD